MRSVAIRFVFFFLAVFLGAVGGATNEAIAQQPTNCNVKILNGPVQGTFDSGVCAFLGVPYAAPPVGALRWKPPQPVAPWAQPLNATQLGPVCPQYQNRGALPSGPIIGNEDCLHLNVWRPEPPTARAAPVMVFFHPGRFILQSGTEATFNGGNLARMFGMVVVTINSRLGPLGYFAHRLLAAEDPKHPLSGNYGFLDRQAALQWVRRNIAQFGGDPENVTLFGEATGSNSITEHIISPQDAGLFKNVILQSATAQRESGNLFFLPSMAEYQTVGERLTAALGCDTANDVIACMRLKTPAQIWPALSLRSVTFGTPLGNTARWLPVVDGVYIPDQPFTLLESGKFNRVHAIAGAAREDAFVLVPRNMSLEDYVSRTNIEFGKNALNVLAQYPADRYPSPTEAAESLATEAWFTCPARALARALSKKFPGDPREWRAYRYSYNHSLSLPLNLPAGHPLRRCPRNKTGHDCESFLIFRNPPENYKFTADDLKVSDAIMGYWTRFAATGDPNGAGAVHWPVYDPVYDWHLNIGAAVTEGSGLSQRNCDFWDAVLPPERRGIFYFAQAGGGGGFLTTINLTNPSIVKSISGKVSFSGSDGKPLSSVVDESEVSFAIPPSGTVTIGTKAQGSTRSGYARISSPDPVIASAAYSVPSFPLLAVAPSISFAVLLSSPFTLDRSQAEDLGIAVVNISEDALRVILALYDSDGLEVGTRSLILEPGEQLNRLVGDLFPGMQRFSGELVLAAQDPFPLRHFSPRKIKLTLVATLVQLKPGELLTVRPAGVITGE